MYPVICKIGPLTIYSYGMMFAIAAFVSMFLLSREAKKAAINKDVIVDFVFWVLLSGIIGARFFYIFMNLSFFKKNPKEIFMLQNGGLVWYGGLIASIMFGILYLRIKKLPMIKALDLVAPYVALGQSIGRVGCFLNGCCFGKPSDIFGIYFPALRAKLFPVQLLSSFVLFLIFVILKFRQKKSTKPGEILFLYLILASLERFIAEFFRGDTPAFIWHLTIFQVISLVIFIIAVLLYGKILLKGRKGV